MQFNLHLPFEKSFILSLCSQIPVSLPKISLNDLSSATAGSKAGDTGTLCLLRSALQTLFSAAFLGTQDALTGMIHKITYLIPCLKATLGSITLLKDLRKTFSPLLSLENFIFQLYFLAAVMFFCCRLFDRIQL